MAQGEIQLTGTITTLGATDTYPTHKASLQLGGWREVANIEERNAITMERRTVGMVVNVLDYDGKGTSMEYELKGGITNDDWWPRTPHIAVSAEAGNALIMKPDGLFISFADLLAKIEAISGGGSGTGGGGEDTPGGSGDSGGSGTGSGENDPIRTISSRLVYRHPSDEGSVVVYNEFGVEKKMLVYDAVYRGQGMGLDSNNTYFSQLGKHETFYYYYPTVEDNAVNKQGSLSVAELSDLSAYRDNITDERFSEALAPHFPDGIMSATQATNIITTSNSATGALFCRRVKSLVSGKLPSVPNAYQSLVLYAEGDVLDSLDKSINDYPKRALGKFGSNSKRLYNGGTIWTSTQRSSESHFFLNSYFGLMASAKTANGNDVGIVPIIEL